MENDQLPEVFIGRQPVLDRQQAVIGYELLFRQAQDNWADFADGKEATADVVCKAFAELGLANALGSQRAFINTDEAFLCDDVVELLPKESVLLEVGAAALRSAAMLERCRELRAKGYELCISGVTGREAHLEHVLPLSSYVKVDAIALRDDGLAAAARQLLPLAPRAIATRVESVEQMRRCADLGFQYFQGYYFARPVVIEGRRLDPASQALIHIINLISQDAELVEIEAALKHQPALAVNLLRLTNSVGVGLSVRVVSVRHAVTVLGRRQLLRWLQLLLFSHGGASIGTNPLMQLSALRGYFLELLASRRFPGRRDMRDLGFLVGLMSLMPTALHLPMTEILAQIAVATEVRLALSHREGELGQLLQLVECYDANDMVGAEAAMARIGGLTPQDLGECLTAAIAWVQLLDVNVE